MKEILHLITLAILCSALFGCGNDTESDVDSGADSDTDGDSDTDSDSEDCNEEDTRCVGEVLQVCQDGEWVDEMDCAALDLECMDVHDHGYYLFSDCSPRIHFLDDFESYSSGDYIVGTAGDPWQTWSNPPLTGEDAQISDSQAVRGVNSLYIAPDNHILFSYNLQPSYVGSGLFIIGFEMFVEPDKMGYYNVSPENENDQEIGVYFYPNGQGILVLYEMNEPLAEYPFEFPVGEWFTCANEIDVDKEYLAVSINEKEIYKMEEETLILNIGCVNRIEFHGLTDDTYEPSYYLDDIRLVEPGGYHAY